MKRFHFNLQKALDLRAYREQDAEIELGRAMSRLTELTNRLKALAEERSRAAADRFARSNSAEDMRAYERYITRLDNQKEELLEEAAAAELAVNEKREAWLAASRDRKVLDKLREKRFGEYRKLALREEIKLIDDAASGRFREKTSPSFHGSQNYD
ncbi:MAG: flagellar export protein FliJ [Spirochaetaceae bacterium]|jgi:flagellar FliJ protein|nr:flagellar export protein FliJ [Spirochaetaceae bacterium]